MRCSLSLQIASCRGVGFARIQPGTQQRRTPHVHPEMPRAPTILLVDDESDLRDIIVAILAAPGYEVLSVSDPYEAIRILVSRHVDLLLTDIRLPGLDGFELARQAKLMRPRLHVIYISGYSAESEREKGPTNGLLLPKPIRMGELLGAVNRELGLSAG